MPRRLILLYGFLALLVAGAFAVALSIGNGEEPQPVIAGTYELTPRDDCLGRTFTIRQSGQFATVDAEGSGDLRIEDGLLDGDIDCDGTTTSLVMIAEDGRLRGAVGDDTLEATLVSGPPPPESSADRKPSSVSGTYGLAPTSRCLGSELQLDDSGGDVSLSGGSGVSGDGTYEDGQLKADALCQDGTAARLSGEAADRTLQLRVAPLSEDVQPERLEATKTRDLNETLIAFFGAVVVVIAAARFFGSMAAWLGQPRVMGEVVAGILLGPTAFGALAPEAQAIVFPSDLIPILGVVANLGLAYYMFTVGMEANLGQVRNRMTRTFAISNASVAIPFALGLLAAIPTFELLAPDTTFAAFAIFLGVAMSITAFPVLARILIERGMLVGRVGTTALLAAAVDDVTAWFLIALALAVASSTSIGGVLETIALAVAFVLVMVLVIRPLLRAVARQYERWQRGDILALVLGGVLACAYATEQIGISLIFGAFMAGLVMPRRTRLAQAAESRIEAFILLVLLPLFFAYTGLRTDVGLLDRSELWLIAGGLLLVAIAGKFLGAMFAARISGFDWRGSAVMGTLMNTRGLTELIVLNIALEAGVISQALFAALVLMALITTFMAGPLLKVFDPDNSLARAGASPVPDGGMGGDAAQPIPAAPTT
jgi:Kef-type K+ transport system membrane component KefB